MSPANNEKHEKLVRARDWCLYVLRFLNKVSPAEIFSQMMDVVEETFNKKDLRGLQMLERDIAENARALPNQAKKELDELLVAEIGWGLSALSNKEHQKVAKVLRRGAIESDEEYRILSDRADAIFDDTTKATELREINALLASYVIHQSGRSTN